MNAVADPSRSRRADTDPVAVDAHLGVRRGDAFTLDVELHLEPGETTVLLGPNGAGKSTTVDAIAGLAPLDHGRLRVGRRVLDDPAADVFVPAAERCIGVVFQQYLLFEHLDVIDNVSFGLRCQGIKRPEARRRVAPWLEALDLADLATRAPRELSGGQAQRVALARALAAEPDVLLLDEPLAALDVDSRRRLRRVIADHVSTFAGPRLVITHDPTDAFALADRIVIVEAGRVTQAGDPDAIRRRPATPYAAAVAGTNRLTGVLDDGTVTVGPHRHRLRVASTATDGAVAVTIEPRAVALYPDQPHGSPRNTWATVVEDLDERGPITRVTLGAPLPLSADITTDSARALALRPGVPIWATVKATEIDVAADRTDRPPR